MRIFKRVLTGVLIVVGLVGGVALGFWASRALPNAFASESVVESHSSEIIQSVNREEQVVLLSLGIQGIESTSEEFKLFGVNVPGSERAKFIQYTFSAKLGFEGKDVEISQTGENEYLISFPEFVFIGHYQPEFKVAAENNGVLSWATGDIDETAMITKILSAEQQDKYISMNEEILRDQAVAFYTRIISSLDPTAVVEFEHALASEKD